MQGVNCAVCCSWLNVLRDRGIAGRYRNRFDVHRLIPGQSGDQPKSNELSCRKPSYRIHMRFDPASLIVAHDYFAIRGGGERLVLDLARGLNASIIYGYATMESYERELFPAATRDLRLPPFLRRRGLHLPALAWAFGRQRNRLASFDTRIFSGVCAPLAAPIGGTSGRNIFYCHTPPRFLYDQRDFFQGQSSLFTRLGMAMIGASFERSYVKAIERMHAIVANSENTRGRISQFLGRDSVVVHPPCDTAGFTWGEPQGYYLSTARLAPLKRIDRIIDAFRLLPDKRLVVTSGGESADALRVHAAGAANISFTGWIGETDLRSLVAGAIATVYVPVDEDFGMSPVESMAAGKPVIGVAEGGLLETVVNGETGILLQKDFTAEDLAETVNWLSAKRAMSMRHASQERAAQFARTRFIDRMLQVIEFAHSQSVFPTTKPPT